MKGGWYAKITRVVFIFGSFRAELKMTPIIIATSDLEIFFGGSLGIGSRIGSRITQRINDK